MYQKQIDWHVWLSELIVEGSVGVQTVYHRYIYLFLAIYQSSSVCKVWNNPKGPSNPTYIHRHTITDSKGWHMDKTFLLENVCCGYLSNLPHSVDSNLYQNHTILWQKNLNNYPQVNPFISSYLLLLPASFPRQQKKSKEY